MGFLDMFQKGGKYFGKDVPPHCEYCDYGKRAKDGNKVLCDKRGLVDAEFHCSKFTYSPLKRIPVKQLTRVGLSDDENDSFDDEALEQEETAEKLNQPANKTEVPPLDLDKKPEPLPVAPVQATPAPAPTPVNATPAAQPAPAPAPVYTAPAAQPAPGPVYTAPAAQPAPAPAPVYSTPTAQPAPAPAPVYTTPAAQPVPAPQAAPAPAAPMVHKVPGMDDSLAAAALAAEQALAAATASVPKREEPAPIPPQQ